jgi:hypothetical protein
MMKTKYIVLGILCGFGLVVFVYYLVKYFNKPMIQTTVRNVGVDVSPFSLMVSPIGIQDSPIVFPPSPSPIVEPKEVGIQPVIEPVLIQEAVYSEKPGAWVRFISFFFWLVGMVVTAFIFTLGTAAFAVMSYQGTIPMWVGIPLAAFSAIIGIAGLVKLLRAHPGV